MPAVGPDQWEMPLAAASLIRAYMVGDQDAGVLIIQQHGGHAAAPNGGELTRLTLAVVDIAVRILMSANGFNPHKAREVINQWIETYAKADSAAKTAP